MNLKTHAHQTRMIRIALIALFFGVGLPSLSAEPGSSATAARPEIRIQELKYRLRPLTQNELAIEADDWQSALKTHLTLMSELYIEMERSDEAGKKPLRQKLTQLEEQKSGLIERMELVIDELQIKGGEVQNFHTYLAAVSDREVQPNESSSFLAQFSDWIESPQGGLTWLKNIFLFLLTLAIFKFLSDLAARATGKAVERFRNRSELLKHFCVGLVQKSVLIVGAVVALTMLEIDVTPVLAALAAVGFIVGFALQDTIGNFASGLMILFYRPFDLDDFIEIEEVRGTVTSITLVATSLKLPDNQMAIIPNKSVWGKPIINISGSPTRRVDILFRLSRDDDLGKAEEICERITTQHPLVLENPAPLIKPYNIADSSIQFIVRPWTKSEHYFTVYCDITREVMESLEQAGIKISYTRQDVRYLRPDLEDLGNRA